MAEVAPATAKMRMVQLADEIIAVLSSDPNAAVKVTVDITAEFPDGATDQLIELEAYNMLGDSK